MPSSRELATAMRLGRVTVITAYEELVAEGLLKTEVGNGTFVMTKKEHERFARTQRADVKSPPPDKHLSAYANRILKLQKLTATSADLPELDFGAPPPELLPLKLWRSILQRQCSIHVGKRFDVHVDPLGHRKLREALPAYLNRSRGLNCTAEQIAVFASSQQTVSLVLRLLVDRDDEVAIENPGFTFARKIMRSLEASLLPIDVDDQGMIVDQLQNHPRCKLAYVTPSHQDPLGPVLSVKRRAQLLDWAATNNCYIIEDDYDCEYNYGTVPLPALQGQDEHQSVIYISTFWKILYPVMPIGFVVAPPNLVPAMTKAKILSERNFSLLEQYALAEFIDEGHLERHIRKTRKLYSERRRALISALTRAFGRAIEIPSYSSGMHIKILLKAAHMDDDMILNFARESELPIVSTKDYYLKKPRPGEFLISFAGKSTETFTGRVNKFARSIGPL